MNRLYLLLRFMAAIVVLNMFIWEPSGLIKALANNPVDPWHPIILGFTLVVALLAAV